MKAIKELEQFVRYVNEFYGVGGIYEMKGISIEAIVIACDIYIDRIMYRKIAWQDWGAGDTVDRERVRDILENDMGFKEVKRYA
mgnify:CR=1 FL=1